MDNSDEDIVMKAAAYMSSGRIKPVEDDLHFQMYKTGTKEGDETSRYFLFKRIIGNLERDKPLQGEQKAFVLGILKGLKNEGVYHAFKRKRGRQKKTNTSHEHFEIASLVYKVMQRGKTLEEAGGIVERYFKIKDFFVLDEGEIKFFKKIKAYDTIINIYKEEMRTLTDEEKDFLKEHCKKNNFSKISK